MTDVNDYLVSMYAKDDEEEGEAAVVAKPNAQKSTGKTRLIHVGAIKYEVPNPEYVLSLEKKIEVFEKTIADQDRRMKRLESTVRHLVNMAKKTGSSINDLYRDVDNKIDRRD